MRVLMGMVVVMVMRVVRRVVMSMSPAHSTPDEPCTEAGNQDEAGALNVRNGARCCAMRQPQSQRKQADCCNGGNGLGQRRKKGDQNAATDFSFIGENIRGDYDLPMPRARGVEKAVEEGQGGEG